MKNAWLVILAEHLLFDDFGLNKKNYEMKSKNDGCIAWFHRYKVPVLFYQKIRYPVASDIKITGHLSASNMYLKKRNQYD